jgi:hypothetical protein
MKGAIAIMKRITKGILALVIVFGLVGTALSQSVTIVVQVLDGRNGKPLINERLLVFSGESRDDTMLKKYSLSINTDKEGLASLTINPSESKWIQVWVDTRTLCQSNPNSKSYSIATILKTGLAADNTCSKLVRDVGPNHFIVFARPATFIEKMRW